MTTTAADYKQLTRFLVELGVEQIAHSQKNYLAHLVGVYHLMQTHGCDAELCRARMFHSIYGTEKFQFFKIDLDRRSELETLIGRRAERLAFWNCFMQRASFDQCLEVAAESYTIAHRETLEELRLTRDEYDDLCRVHLFDWLEQVPRSRFGWGYRREAYQQMADRLGGAALQTYRAVFAAEPASSNLGSSDATA